MTEHVPVLLEEAVERLNVKPGQTYVDCTVGTGGHAARILEESSPDGRLIAVDRDGQALGIAREKLRSFGGRVVFFNRRFGELASILEESGAGRPAGFLFDLGVSLLQIEDPDRGFSYRLNGPLDMRMNQSDAFTAYEVVNEYSERKLTEIISEYGEENWANRIAKFIVEARSNKPIETTFELVEIIKNAIPAAARKDGPHPAKRTFQAIRIEVNNELRIIEQTIEDAVKHLNKGGRIAIITFHSLEDRIVKNAYKKLAQGCTCPPEFPVCVCGGKPKVKIITKKPILPSDDEIEGNPRARSAKLRVAEKK